MTIMIRRGEPRDEESLVRMRKALWSEESLEDCRAEARALLTGRWPSLLPAAVLIAEREGEVVGFVEVSLRSYADGCALGHPVGYLEGWYVDPKARGHGVGKALVEAAETWSRNLGCREMASDTWTDNEGSRRAHAALGFEVVDHCVNFRKALDPDAAGAEDHYGPDLAALHHHHFGRVARAAGAELKRRLRAAGFADGVVVDLATGSGILPRTMVDAGFTALGVDISSAMLELARSSAPEATFVEGSLWRAEIPAGAVAVTAVGEAFSYAADPAAGLEALRERLTDIHRALVPGGLLLFDVAGPGRSGPTGARQRILHRDGAYVHVDEREDGVSGILERELSLLLPFGRLYRRVSEKHRLVLLPAESLGDLLTAAGFRWERIPGYGDTDLPSGWNAFIASK